MLLLSIALCTNVRAQGASYEKKLATMPFAIQRFDVLDTPTSTSLGRVAGFEVHARYLPGSESKATFELFEHDRKLFSFTISDLYNPNGWFVEAPNGKAFAVTWSDGGAIGGFHTRLFMVNAKDRIEERTSVLSSSIKDFESRHFCKTRGDNFLAVRWLNNKALLMEANVYPTSDCGPDLGYTERYVLRASDGIILKRVAVERDR